MVPISFAAVIETVMPNRGKVRIAKQCWRMVNPRKIFRDLLPLLAPLEFIDRKIQLAVTMKLGEF
jgi:hypothetical protein